MPLSPQRAGSVLYSLAMFVVVSALAGLLVAGLFVPLAGMAGVSSKAAAQELEKLPADFTTPPQPERTRVLLANGDLLANFYEQNRTYVPLSKIAPIMRQAQVAIEDHRFYEHGALDVRGTLRALVRNSAADGISQGGSSITQQYVKMVQIEKAQEAGDDAAVAKATEKSYTRKVQELRYAIALEKELSKDQILERYLNIAYYGEGAYGVQAAAQHYFRVDAGKLDLPQAAMLAGLVQNPGNNPVQNPTAAIERRNVVLNRMADPELNLITTKQAAAAKAVKFDKSKVRATKKGCVGTKYPFLCDYVYRSLLQTPSLGKTTEERANMVNRGGLTIQTAIDPAAQDKAQKAVTNMVEPKDNVISTMVELQPGTGLIVAMAQSRPVMGADKSKGETYFNYAVSEGMGGAEGYQAGSTFKAFTAAAALDKGIPLSKKYNARATMDFTGTSWSTCKGTHVQTSPYKPKNSTGTNGVMDMRKAAARSVNTYFLQLEKTVGLCDTIDMAKKLGVESSDGKDMQDEYGDSPAFTLGVVNVTPLSMAKAYATFAARGVRCDPVVVDTITTKAGKKLAPPSANCERVIPEDVADAVNSLLAGVMSGNGTGTPARLSDGRPEAGKTGTINSARAVWFAGYTPELTGIAMIAGDNQTKRYRNQNHGIAGQTLKYSGQYLNGSGGGDAGRRIWKPAMEKALADVPATKFKAPPSDLVRGKMTTVPRYSGLSFEKAKTKLEDAGFTVQDRYVYNSANQGTFLGYSVSGGDRVRQFATIYRTWSRGEDPAVVAARQQARDDAKKQAAADQKKKDDAAKKKAAADAKKKAAADAKKKAAGDPKKKKPGG
ncbi:MAG: transglycosylase domain-containing protein [Propionibacteriaceae bacterium]